MHRQVEEPIEERAILELAQELEHRDPALVRRPGVGGQAPGAADRLPIAQPGREPRQGQVARVVRQPCAITSPGQRRGDRRAAASARGLVQRGKQRPPSLGRGGRGQQPAQAASRGRAPFGGESADQARQDRRPEQGGLPGFGRREPAQGPVDVGRRVALDGPPEQEGDVRVAGVEVAQRTAAGRHRDRRAGETRRAVQASWLRTVASGSRPASSRIAAAARRELVGSSPMSRTVQARTSASGCSSRRSASDVVEAAAAVESPEGFERRGVRGLRARRGGAYQPRRPTAARSAAAAPCGDTRRSDGQAGRQAPGPRPRRGRAARPASRPSRRSGRSGRWSGPSRRRGRGGPSAGRASRRRRARRRGRASGRRGRTRCRWPAGRRPPGGPGRSSRAA